jgi:hypothetical protein
MGTRVLLLIGCLLADPLAAAGIDGRWRLTISGHTTYRYGEPQLGAGLRMPWEVVIGFQVSDGVFALGHGRAQLTGEAAQLSHPPGWLSCRQVQGSYLDSSLTLHETPRIRFAAFPLAGEVDGHEVTLLPGYQPPGNYLAVTYECETRDARASNWFTFAERGKQVLGKRQDAERRVDGDYRHARVREVATLPPEGSLTLPLVDGWRFSRGSADDDNWVSYRLSRE